MHTLPGKSGWLRQTPLDRHAQDFLVGADHLVADSDHALQLHLGGGDCGHDVHKLRLAGGGLRRQGFRLLQRLLNRFHRIHDHIAEIAALGFIDGIGLGCGLYAGSLLSGGGLLIDRRATMPRQ